MNPYLTLAGRIRASTDELSILLDRIEDYLQKALRSDELAYWDAVALNLHGFYSGVERIFEDIARTIDASVPSSPEWHLDLLLQMASDVKGIRPPVISREVRGCLDEYRGFRHVVRNVYTFNLRPSRIRELAENLPACYQEVSKELEAFASFVDSVG